MRFSSALILSIFLFTSAKAQLIVNVKPDKPASVPRTPPPGPAYTWVEEDWQVVHDQYEWAGGRWEPQPMRRVIWIPGRWERRNNGYVWVPGIWKNTLLRGNYVQSRYARPEYKEQVIVDSKKDEATR